MLKFYSLVFVLCAVFSIADAQTDSLSKADKAMLDSMMANDEFLKLMNEGQKNTVDISIGVGNGSFSAHNNAANATGVVNQLIFTPSVMYRTKEGFSIGVSGFVTDDSSGKLNLYQTGVSAAYDYNGKEILSGISYTRYLSDKNKYNTKALYQNDVYGYVKRAKGIIQPGLALGYASGNYKETSFRRISKKVHLPLPLPNGRDTVIVISGNDSTNNKVSYFSASVSAEHNFSFYKLFSKNDGLDFTPSLILNCGSDKNTQTHTNGIFDRVTRLTELKKVESNNKFQMQSVAVSFDFTYGVGKFFLQPNLYLDYYLPETTAQRFSAIFSVTAGFSF